MADRYHGFMQYKLDPSDTIRLDIKNASSRINVDSGSHGLEDGLGS